MTDFPENSLYSSVESALGLMDSDIGPAECHGMLCGMLCGTTTFDPASWLGHATGYHDDAAIVDLGPGHALSELLRETVNGFESEDFSLRILVPDDDEAIAVRAAALGAWCRGFLSGFGLVAQPSDAELSDDAAGFLRDLQQIGRIDETAENADDESSFMELCEYTRMGALLLREEMQGVASRDNSETIH